MTLFVYLIPDFYHTINLLCLCSMEVAFEEVKCAFQDLNGKLCQYFVASWTPFVIVFFFFVEI